MARNWATKEIRKVHRLTDKRLLHEIDIPNQAGKKCAKRKENGDAVWPERFSLGHRMSDERRPNAHQNSGHHTSDDALFRDCAISCGQRTVRFSIEDYRNHGASDSRSKQHHIALWLKDVARNDADHERNAD